MGGRQFASDNIEEEFAGRRGTARKQSNLDALNDLFKPSNGDA